MKDNKEITPEKVSELYKKHNNKHLFLANFGTTRFHLCGEERLVEMYNYLNKKLTK